MEFKDEKILNNIITVILVIIILHIIFTVTCPLYNRCIFNCRNKLRKLSSGSKNKKHKHIGVEKFNDEGIYTQSENIEPKPQFELKQFIEPKPYIPIISELPLPIYKPLETNTKKINMETSDNINIRESLLSSIINSENENKPIFSNVDILPDNIPPKQGLAVKKNIPLVNNNIMSHISSDENIYNKHISDENVYNKNISDENVYNKNISDKNVYNKNISDENVYNKNISDKNVYNKNISDENIYNKHINVEYDKLHNENNIPIPHNINDSYEYINENENELKLSRNEIHVHSSIEPMDYLSRHATFNNVDSKPLKITNKTGNYIVNDYVNATCCNNVTEHHQIKPTSESKSGTDFYDNKVGEYLRDTLIGSQHYCGENEYPSKKWDDDLKKERDKFFDFNDHINKNSNPNNMAFKVQKLYNESNMDVSLSKIYDNAVKESIVFEKQCVKTPIYDDITKTGAYTREGTTGSTFLKDNWMYNNDKIINGGQISDNLYAYDPIENNQAIY